MFNLQKILEVSRGKLSVLYIILSNALILQEMFIHIFCKYVLFISISEYIVSVNALLMYLTAEHFQEYFSALSLNIMFSSCQTVEILIYLLIRIV